MSLHHKISVIIPVYNVEKYLPRCIESVLSQTYNNLEIILVNDGSKDNSGKICDNYAKIDKRIIIIHKDNGGLSDARNKGLDIATGDYIGFIDSDDFVDVKFYETLYNEIISQDADISICQYQKFSHENQVKYQNLNDYKKIVVKGRYVLDNLYDTKYFYPDCIVAWNKLYKKHIWENLRYPKGKYREDEFVCHKIFMNTHKAVFIKKEIYYYFQREDSIMNKKHDTGISQKDLDFLEAFQERLNFCVVNHLDILYQQTINKRNYFLIEFYRIANKNLPDSVKKIIKENYNQFSFKEKVKYSIIKFFPSIYNLYKK